MTAAEGSSAPTSNDPLAAVRTAAAAAIRQSPYLSTRWPGTYSLDFLRNHADKLPLPDSLHAALPLRSRHEASGAMQTWADELGVHRDELAAVLADAYLQEWHIPLEEAAAERARTLPPHTRNSDVVSPSAQPDNPHGAADPFAAVRAEIEAVLGIHRAPFRPDLWPHTYAVDFLRRHTDIIPDRVLVALPAAVPRAPAVVSREDAAIAMLVWADDLGVPVDDLAALLADGGLREYDIPLESVSALGPRAMLDKSPPDGQAAETTAWQRLDRIRSEVRSRTRSAEQAYAPISWPYDYAALFLRTHVSLIPHELYAAVSGVIGSRQEAADVLTRWAQIEDVPRAALAGILADAYLVERGLPLMVAHAQRTNVPPQDPFFRPLEPNP